MRIVKFHANIHLPQLGTKLYISSMFSLTIGLIPAASGIPITWKDLKLQPHLWKPQWYMTKMKLAKVKTTVYNKWYK